MCGIIGYVGEQECAAVLLDGLKRLEYRGYDSSGVATISNNVIERARAKGKLKNLADRLDQHPIRGTIGIGHTRWATHGIPSEGNAHPHQAERVSVVHNGIIENYVSIKNSLLESGYRFESETDTEIIPKLIDFYLDQTDSFETATRKAIQDIHGAFAFAAISSKYPGQIVVAKNSSPLVIGIGENENYIASDIPAILNWTREVIVLDDGEMALITDQSFEITTFEGEKVSRDKQIINWSIAAAEKEGHKHFMLKEINEQPTAISDALRGRFDSADQSIVLNELDKIDLNAIHRIVIVACGTSWHSAKVAKYWIEDFAKIPVEVDLASEFRYRKPVLGQNTLFVGISQSGETADTLAALKLAKDLGAKIVSVCNCMESSMTRISDAVLFTQAGPEIGVASTKAFTTQLAVLALFSMYLAERTHQKDEQWVGRQIENLRKLPLKIENILDRQSDLEKIAAEFLRTKGFLFVGSYNEFSNCPGGSPEVKRVVISSRRGLCRG